MIRALWIVGVLSFVGCVVRGLDLDGRPCPCDDNYVCDTRTNTCVAELAYDAAATQDLPNQVDDSGANGPVDLTAGPTGWVTSLAFSSGTLTPAFSGAVTSYDLTIPVDTLSLTATVTTIDEDVGIAINGATAQSGEASRSMDVRAGLVPVTITLSDAALGITYHVNVMRATYFKPPVDNLQEFGSTVALSNDTLVVGTIADNKAYVYVRATDGTWLLQATLAPSAVSSISPQFGRRVGIDGDTIVVGAPNDWSNATGINGDPTNASAMSSGAIWVFARANGTWSQQAYIKPSVDTNQAGFGTQFSISGDTIAVGQPDDPSSSTVISYGTNPPAAKDTSRPAAGAIFVFSRSGTTWAQSAYIKAADSGQFSFFGDLVALSGNTLATTMYCGTSCTALAYVFVQSGGKWSLQQELMSTAYYFGSSIALDGNTLAIGAPKETNGTQPQAGGFYVYGRSGTTWNQVAHGTAPTPLASYDLAGALAISGGVIAAGALYGDYGDNSDATGIDGDVTNQQAPGSGAVYLYKLAGTTLTEWHYVKSLNTGAHFQFGASVALESDLLAVGAPWESSLSTGINGNENPPDAGSPMNGAVYAYPLQ